MKEPTADQLVKEWEERLKREGLPAEPLTESQRAAKVGIRMESLDSQQEETSEIVAQLEREDSTNKFGGFPESFGSMTALVITLRDEWMETGTKRSDIRIAVHPSCVNGADCVTMSRNRGEKFHYNTGHIADYSREEMIHKLRASRLEVIEF